MSMLIIYKLVTTVASFFTVLFATQLFLKFFDWLLGVDFKDVLNKVLESPRATALYFGLRWLGASVSIALVVLLAFVL